MLKQFRSAITFAAHLPRYQEILAILFKYGFADVLKLVVLEQLLGMSDVKMTEHEDGILAKPLAERMRLALEELGPTFIKLGQILSSRRDLISDDYYEELCKLQDHVPSFPMKEVERIIKESLGASTKSLFKSFDEKPHGCASIAQVHQAVLHDGAVVAIKVQRPNITEIIELDLAILADLAIFLEHYVPEISGLNPKSVVAEFSVTLLKELDFNNEAINAERFAQQFEGEESICIPKIYRELTDTRVLTMEYMTGIAVTDVKLLRKKHISPSIVAQRITQLIYQQIFQFGFFHADPHPGNMVIMPHGVVGLYDYGMMGTFTPEFRNSVARLIAGIAKKNYHQVMRSILEMSDEGCVDNAPSLLVAVEEFADQNLNRALRDISLGDVLNKLLNLLRDHHLKMKGSFYLGIKALTQVEAIGRQLDPDINFIMLGDSFASDLLMENYSPKRLWKLFLNILTGSIDFAEELPNDIRLLYSQIKHGKLRIPLEHRIAPEGIEPLRQTLDSVCNRLVNALLASSLLIASSILVHTGLPPVVFGVPLIGLLGLLFGFFMCIRLALSIWKHGGL